MKRIRRPTLAYDTRLPERDKLDAVIAKLAAMSPAEILQKSIESGIHAPGGRLMPQYQRRPKR